MILWYAKLFLYSWEFKYSSLSFFACINILASVFKFSKFVQADNTEVDIQKTNFSENTFIKAIFEYKENPSPVNPTNPENDKPNTNKNKPIKEPAPNTAVDNYCDLNNIFLSIIIIVLTCGGCLGCLKCAIRK